MGMTLDEHIYKAEEDAKMAEFDTEWGIGNYFIDRKEALEYAKECRQLAEWLRDYKRLKEQEPKTGHCKDCKHFRKLPLRTDTIGKCIQHWGVCPPCDWYCADFEPQESEDK